MLGTFGSGGTLLVIIVCLVIHRRKHNGRIKPVKDHHVFYWGAAAGLLSAGAGEAFRNVSTISRAIDTSITSQAGVLGQIGPAAVALVVVLIGFGMEPRFWKDLICGVAAPGILSAAGAPWTIPVLAFASILHSIVGAM